MTTSYQKILVDWISAVLSSDLNDNGVRDLAKTNLAKATYARQQLASEANLEVVYTGPHFNEFAVQLPGDAGEIVDRCSESSVVPGVPLGWFDAQRSSQLLVCVTEIHRRAEIDRLVTTLAEVCR